MGFSVDVSVSVATVFLQGLLSFFSPCVLPLIPLYMGYLSGGTRSVGEDGRVTYKRSRVMVNTLFFVLGVSFTFFLLGAGVSALGRFFSEQQLLFARIGGILVILFGLYQLGVFGKLKFFGREHRLPLRVNALAMSPAAALIMGFTFSFAWTPCVGPALASVLLMAASAGTRLWAFALIGVYTLGFVLPFLAVGLFTASLLELFKKHGRIVLYTVKAGGVLMLLMGVMMLTGKMNAVTGYLSRLSPGTVSESAQESGEGQNAEKAEETDRGDKPQTEGNADGEAGGPAKEEGSTPGADAGDRTGTESEADAEDRTGTESEAGQEKKEENEKETEADTVPAIDFERKDQYGQTHRLSDYKGKTIFLNFWATWCPPCKREMPDIQKLYEEYSAEEEPEVVILGVAAPGYGSEGSEEEIREFLEENGYTYPVLMDTGGELFASYGVYSYPTTFMIDRDGNVFGYVSGQLTEDIMRSIIRQTQEGKRE